MFFFNVCRCRSKACITLHRPRPLSTFLLLLLLNVNSRVDFYLHDVRNVRPLLPQFTF